MDDQPPHDASASINRSAQERIRDMAHSQDSSNGGEQQDEIRRRAKTSTNEPHKPGTEKVEGDEGERAPDDQGNAITDQKVNQNVAERAQEQEEEKK
jgi:hypothetical protein